MDVQFLSEYGIVAFVLVSLLAGARWLLPKLVSHMEEALSTFKDETKQQRDLFSSTIIEERKLFQDETREQRDLFHKTTNNFIRVITEHDVKDE